MTAQSDRETGIAAPAEPAQPRSQAAARARRPAWRSPMTWRILLLNVLVLLIPIAGLMHLDQYRDSLIEAELEALRTQARAFSTTLANSAVVVTQSGDERLLREASRHAVRVLLAGGDVRARLFVPDGQLVVDSFMVAGAAGKVEVEQLPAPEDGGIVPDDVQHTIDELMNWVPGNEDLPLYREPAQQSAADYQEVKSALGGTPAGMVRRDRHGGLVLSVALPVQRYRQILGALMVSKHGRDVEAAVRDRRLDILLVFGVALAVTVLLSFYLARTIAQPVRRLAEAADRVRRAQGRQVEIPDFTRRGDEIGDLSGALREMTDALWKRLDAIERFAADVAHEIKNPLTSVRSAVETVARVDDPEQQKRLMAIVLDDVQRLDRLISDISDASRLDAELSRAQSEPVSLARLLEALVEVERAGLDGDGTRIELRLPERGGVRDDLTVPGLEGRLAQVFRNLLKNAVSFSPEGSAIRIGAWREDGDVVVEVADSGPGIPEGKLEAIFERFYSERPKAEKFGTHSGLGLAISKQIVEAHGGSIRAENRRDGEGNVLGARFVVRLPSE